MVQVESTIYDDDTIPHLHNEETACTAEPANSVEALTTMCPSDRHSLRPSGFRPAFDLLDADRDGKIGPGDLRSFFSSSPISDDDIGSMIALADLDRNGFVEFGEFERVLVGDPRGGEDRWIEEVFRAMDRDGDGRVGFEDLKAHLRAAGVDAGDDDVRAMIRLGGGGECGGVPLEGFARILTVDFPRPV